METYYTVYKVTNLINGKFYIGTHKTKDQNDEYMGSGKYLKYSQEKHGINNFKKKILFVYDNPEQMFNKEAELVNEDFLAEENTYNLKLGGFGGWDHCNKNKTNEDRIINGTKGGLKYKSLLNNSEFREKISKIHSESQKKSHNSGNRKPHSLGYATFTGEKHSEETKKLISEKAKKRLKNKSNHSQYGTRWIYSLEEKRSTKIKKNEPLPINWLEGRKIKFNAG